MGAVASMITMKDYLLEQISSRSIVVGIVGLGYVGLPLAVEMAKAGFETIGFDVQDTKVDMVNSGQNYIGDVADEDISTLVKSGIMSATTDFKKCASCGFIAICVPTPLDKHQQPDTSYIEQSVKEIAKHLKPATIVVLESTTYPGTTEELVKYLLEEGSGLQSGTDFYLGFSPERVDPGNRAFKTKNTPKVVGAIGSDAIEVISSMYEAVLVGGVVRVSSPRIAEMEKILENTYRNVNIGLINELAMLCNHMNIDIWEVIDAAKTKPYGFSAFYPGPGLGGHCIPLDPYYLSWKAREHGFHTSMIEASMAVNDRMPVYCVDRASRILNRFGKPINGSSIIILGVAYKQDIDDYRESPALKVLDELEGRGALVSFFDPWVSEFQHNNKTYRSLSNLESEKLGAFDLVMICTAHTNVDYSQVQENANYIFDTRNAMKHITERDNIEVL